MKGHFYFGRFRDGILLTGDTGCWRFLTKDQFNDFMNDEISEDSAVYQMLEEEHFCYHGSQEAFIQDSIDEIRSGNSYLFEATHCLFSLLPMNVTTAAFIVKQMVAVH